MEHYINTFHYWSGTEVVWMIGSLIMECGTVTPEAVFRVPSNLWLGFGNKDDLIKVSLCS